MPDTHNEAEVKRRFPVTTGLLAVSKHEGRVQTLVPQEGSLVARRLKLGIED